jgi:hypothetical protein
MHRFNRGSTSGWGHAGKQCSKQKQEGHPSQDSKVDMPYTKQSASHSLVQEISAAETEGQSHNGQ